MHVVVRKFEGGERAPMLLDEQGVPLSWPTLFATVRLRNAGLAANTIRNKLHELKVLLRWQTFHDRDLEAEFRAGQFLNLADVVSIRDFATKKIDRIRSTRASGAWVDQFSEASLAPVQGDATVSKSVHYNRMTTIADYLQFLGQTVTAHRCDRNIAAAVDRMAKRLRQHRPRGMASNRDEDPDRLSPPTDLVERFIRVGSAGHPDNPFRGSSIQRRNEIVFRLLFETGIRLGELLSLRLDNMEFGEDPNISVQRTHDDTDDSRAYQPVAKTRERTIHISENLSQKIHVYSMEDRARTPGAREHPYLIVTHRKGKSRGQPLSITSVANKVFGSMQRVRPEFATIHPHSFRHHLNYVLSRQVDEHNRRALSGEDSAIEPISEGREIDIRRQLNGHRSRKSGEAYTRRHVHELGKTVGLQILQGLMERSGQSKAADDE